MLAEFLLIQAIGTRWRVRDGRLQTVDHNPKPFNAPAFQLFARNYLPGSVGLVGGSNASLGLRVSGRDGLGETSNFPGDEDIPSMSS